MKQRLLVCFGVLLLSATLFCISCASSPDAANSNVSLDQTIQTAVLYFVERLPRNSRIAVTNFGAPKSAISEYVIEKMEEHFVNTRKFALVDRQTIEEARKELNFNMSGEVGDKTAQVAGQFAGAEIVVFGSLKKVGKLYRMSVRAIIVETLEVGGIYPANIREKDLKSIFGRITTPPPPRKLTLPPPPKLPENKLGEALEEKSEIAYRNSVEYGVNHYVEWNDNYTGLYWEPVSIHWTLLPYTSVGLGVGFGFGNTTDGREIFKAGITPSVGLVFPITENVRLFGDGFMEIGSNSLGSFFKGSAALNPGFDAGMLFSFENGIGFNLRYKGLWTGDGGYVNALGITVSEDARKKSFNAKVARILSLSGLGLCLTGAVGAAYLDKTTGDFEIVLPIEVVSGTIGIASILLLVFAIIDYW